MSCNDDSHRLGEHTAECGGRTAEIVERFGRPWLAAEDIAVEVAPTGPSAAAVARVTALLNEGWLCQQLEGAETRLLSFRILDDDDKDCAPRDAARFAATIYDYTHNRTLRVCGGLEQPERASISETATQPLPTREEFEAAVEILANHLELGAAIRRGELLTYRPMPPLVEVETPDGRIERTLTIGLVPARGAEKLHRLVAVNMIRREILHEFEGRAHDSTEECGPPPARACDG